MDREKMVLRFSTGAVICALALRLWSSGALSPLVQALMEPETAAFLLYMETGRLLRVPATDEQPETSPQPGQTEPAEEIAQTEPEPALPVFSAQDAQLVSLRSYCGYEADVEALMCQPLRWDLTGDEPSVLILHSHGSESYENTENYQPSSQYRTLDAQYNMVSIGREVKALLEAGGIGVIHDETLHDYPSYNDSYNHARSSMAEILEQYPSIQLVLDLHRDAVESTSGEQLGTTVKVDGVDTANIMLVVGSDAAGLSHPDWQKNLALAVKLHASLQSRYPGICRAISFRSQRFNQDLSPGALLVEVGAAGNTRQEALAAARCLANGILDLAKGVEISYDGKA